MPITAGVIDLFSVPPPDLLVRSTTSPVVLANPFSGAGSLACQGGGHNAYGLHWSVVSAPAGAGLSTRSLVVYQESFLSFSLHYTLADASVSVGDTLITGSAEGFYLFAIAHPTSLNFHILPGWTVHFDWMVQP